MMHELQHGAARHKQVVHTALEQESVFSAHRLFTYDSQNLQGELQPWSNFTEKCHLLLS